MPGPESHPYAVDKNGRLVVGKTALRDAGLKSSEGVTSATTPPPKKKEKRP